MWNPYLLMTLLYLSLAVLAAFDSSLTAFTITPWFNGLRWLRVHLITLGTFTELFFGLLPLVAAIHAKQPKPQTRWDIWLSLNSGLLILLVGIPLINGGLIFVGGLLVFIATGLLVLHLNTLQLGANTTGPTAGRKFYLAGLLYLMLGTSIGTGLWLGWASVLNIAIPIEVHIHANSWGFMSLLFAGLLVDLYPDFAGRPLAWPRAVRPIFWLLVVGAGGLVLGPWLKAEPFTVGGILLYFTGTIWLLLNLIKPLLGERAMWSAGLWQILTAYVWVFAPVVAAPMMLLKLPGFPAAGIEQNAPQALIYGWVLQFGCALLPYVFERIFLPTQFAPRSGNRLGGRWLSLIAIHLGGICLWAGIFITGTQATLNGLAYLFWGGALLLLALDLWRIARAGLTQLA
jgi:hypothetical protein